MYWLRVPLLETIGLILNLTALVLPTNSGTQERKTALSYNGGNKGKNVVRPNSSSDFSREGIILVSP
jgi:hypothetical protein